MKLYLARHGESTSNTSNLVCGHSDVELTEKGIRQAKILAREIEELKVDKIISSPLVRADMTAKIIADYNKLPHYIDERLLEFDFGTYEGRKVDDNEFLEFRNQLSHKMPEGESVLEAAQRIYNLLDQIKEDDEVVLLVCHNAISRVINSYFYSLSNEDFFEFNLNNCELVSYEY